MEGSDVLVPTRKEMMICGLVKKVAKGIYWKWHAWVLLDPEWRNTFGRVLCYPGS